jgi:tRNA (adenine37-N6)-methyltransferase
LAWPIEPIGVVRSDRVDLDHTPVQAGLNPREIARAILDDRYADALDGLADFSHIWLVTWLGDPHDGKREPVASRQVPFLLGPQGPEVGIFATRGPRRPNPIGLSLVELVSVEPTSIRFRGVDMIDRTPLLDIKPYVERFDRPRSAIRCGWFDTVELSDGATPADLQARRRR